MPSPVHPFSYKTVFRTAVIMMTGDVAAQCLEMKFKGIEPRGPDGSIESGEPRDAKGWRDMLENVDARRVAQMTVMGGLINGVGVQNWYRVLFHAWPSRSGAHVAAKIVADQVVWAPLTIGIMLGCTLWFRQLKPDLPDMERLKDTEAYMQAYKERIDKHFVNILLTDCCVWPFANYLNFRYVPRRYQTYYYSVISVGWSCYVSMKGWEADSSQHSVCEGTAIPQLATPQALMERAEDSEDFDAAAALIDAQRSQAPKPETSA
jgi:protein Mpv17